MCQGCGLNKWQFLGVRVLPLAAIYPGKLGSVDLILPLGTRGWAQAHAPQKVHACATGVPACQPFEGWR